ncbi:MAG TPA: exo-beta-N-acetylmuramidase NamZ domain-containing protein, partial [Longimicrobium sp.]|nr:exo-beta-N-acetylmuramidase NamZ domain-containing protein [Longimicrobium sp.]
MKIVSSTLVVALALAACSPGPGAAEKAPEAGVAYAATPKAATAPIPGLEVLLRDSIHLVRGKRVGLITNHTAVTRDGRHAVDVLFRRRDVRLVALFAPEHGIRGVADGGKA